MLPNMYGGGRLQGPTLNTIIAITVPMTIITVSTITIITIALTIIATTAATVVITIGIVVTVIAIRSTISALPVTMFVLLLLYISLVEWGAVPSITRRRRGSHDLQAGNLIRVLDCILTDIVRTR